MGLEGAGKGAGDDGGEEDASSEGHGKGRRGEGEGTEKVLVSEVNGRREGGGGTCGRLEVCLDEGVCAEGAIRAIGCAGDDTHMHTSKAEDTHARMHAHR